jgi:hypothetical protein
MQTIGDTRKNSKCENISPWVMLSDNLGAQHNTVGISWQPLSWGRALVISSSPHQIFYWPRQWHWLICWIIRDVNSINSCSCKQMITAAGVSVVWPIHAAASIMATWETISETTTHQDGVTAVAPGAAGYYQMTPTSMSQALTMASEWPKLESRIVRLFPIRLKYESQRFTSKSITHYRWQTAAAAAAAGNYVAMRGYQLIKLRSRSQRASFVFWATNAAHMTLDYNRLNLFSVRSLDSERLKFIGLLCIMRFSFRSFLNLYNSNEQFIQQKETLTNSIFRLAAAAYRGKNAYFN